MRHMRRPTRLSKARHAISAHPSVPLRMRLLRRLPRHSVLPRTLHRRLRWRWLRRMLLILLLLRGRCAHRCRLTIHADPLYLSLPIHARRTTLGMHGRLPIVLAPRSGRVLLRRRPDI